MCHSGAPCDSFDPGHAVHLIHARLVSATPTLWADAIVTDARPDDGVIELALLASGALVRVWNAAGAAASVRVGEPVAVHERYHVLAVGSARFNYLTLE